MRRNMTISEILENLRQGVVEAVTPPPEEQPVVVFDMWRWLRSCMIINQKGQLVPLIVNEGQEEIVQKIMDAEAKGIPPRFICLKSRRVGVSTVILAYIAGKIFNHPYRHAASSAHNTESSIYLFRMIQILFEQLDHQRPLQYQSKKDITFAAPHYSSIKVATAGNEQLFTSFLINYFHASELAKWPNPEKSLTSALQCVPQHADTLVFIESTAAGAGNLFHEYWVSATLKKSDFVPIFLDWRKHTLYSMSLGENETLVKTQQEAAYQKQHSLTEDQTKWMIFTKNNQCLGDIQLFNQEFPVTPEVAFRSQSTLYFHQDKLTDRREFLTFSDGTVKTPPKRGALHVEVVRKGDPDSEIQPEIIVTLKEEAWGDLDIWEFPEEEATYVIGADVGMGLSQDFSVGIVLKLSTKLGERPKQVAEWRSPYVNATDFGMELYKLGTFYNEALICVERNGPGLTTLSVLEHGIPGTWLGPEKIWASIPYGILYYERTINVRANIQTDRLGFQTTKSTKPWLLQKLKSAIAEDHVEINSLTDLDELSGFGYDTVKRVYTQGRRDPVTKLATDDTIMALALAYMLVEYSADTLFFRQVSTSDF